MSGIMKPIMKPLAYSAQDIFGAADISGSPSQQDLKERLYQLAMEAQKVEAEKMQAAFAEQKVAELKENVRVMARQIFANLYSQPAMMIHSTEERYDIARREAEKFFEMERG